MALGSSVRRSLQIGRLGVDVLRARRQPAGPGREALRRLVAARMGDMRGLPHKIGQILSLGEIGEVEQTFSTLTDAAKSVSARESFAWIERELGRPLLDVFRRIDERGAAASLGQVHRAELRDGRPVAVKIQYPGVGDALDADLALLGWLGAPLSARRSGFELRDYRAEMRRNLLEELDYAREVDVLQRFSARATEVPRLSTPVPIVEWCTPRLIVMSWIDGARINDALSWPARARQDAAETLLRLFLRGAFVWRELHADPHAGNLRFRVDGDTGRVGVLDFGCVKTLTEQECAGLRRLAEHGRSLSDDDLFETYVSLGFNRALLEPMAARLGAVTAVLFEPFSTRGPFDPREWRLSARLADALGDDRWNFRFAGPASLLFLIRAFQGLVTYVGALGARLDWRGALLALPAGAAEPVARLSINRRAASAASGGRIPMAACTLRLRVVRGGEQTVQLSFAATAAANLPDLIPVELLGQLHARGIDVRQLADTVVAGGYQPSELFTLDEGDKSVRVWLE